MNRIHTFIDVESGSFISLPKDETDKPPVNADINNNIDTFHSTGGEGTPDMPIDIVNIAEYNKMVTGQNLFDKLQTDIVYSTHSLMQTANGIRITATSQTNYLYANDNYKYFLIAGETYTFKCKWQNSAVRGGKTYFVINRSGKSDFVFGDTYWTNTNEKTTLRNITPTESGYYRIEFYAYNRHTTQDAMLENDYCDFWDIQLLKGEYTAETMPPYTPYTGNNYPYRLEDTDGNLHYGGDLPDGTADSVNWETGEFVEIKGVKVLDGVTETWTLGDVETGYTTFTTPLETDSNSLRCSHFPTVLTDNNLISCDGTTLTLQINTTVLPTQTVQALNIWLGLNNVTVQYKLETPVTYQIKQYGETYGGVVWNKNQKPKSIQYHTNIFTDKNITMQCEVRKLGNRKMGEFYWVTENGDYIVTDDNDYIMLEY
jgi:hypothetical protein